VAPQPEIDVAKNARMVEWLKAELAGGVAGLLHALVKGRREEALDALAEIVIAAFLLGRRLGIPFARLEMKIEAALHANIQQGHQVEEWFGDLTALTERFRSDRGERDG